MKKLILALTMVSLTPAVAFAQVAEAELGGLINGIIEAVKGGNWQLAASTGIMLCVFLATKTSLLPWVKGKHAQWWAAGTGIASAFAATWATSGDWKAAAMNGLVTGAAASGLWSLVGKHLLNKGLPASMD